jgi:hypothetical protein
MRDVSHIPLTLQEAVAAVTGVLREAVAVGHVVDPMAEQPAEISHLFIEGRGCGVRVVSVGKEQRMAALETDVLVMRVAIDELGVGVMPEETREGMPDVRVRAVPGKVTRSALAEATVPGLAPEPVVVDLMAPDGAEQLR